MMESLLSAFLESYFSLRPVNATFTGVHQYDGILPDWSPEGLQRATAEMTSLREGLPPTGSPRTPAEAERAVADGFLEIQLAELAGDHFQRGNPALWTGEAIFGLIGLMIRDFAPAEERAHSLLSRLRAVPSFLAAAERTLLAPHHRLWRSRVERECDAADRLLTSALGEWADAAGLVTQTREALVRAAEPARAAFESFRQHTRSAPPEPAAGGGGAEFYRLLLQRGHWCQEEPAALLEQAETELQAESAAFKDLLEQPGTNWDAVRERLASIHPEATGYLDRFRQQWDHCRQVTVDAELLTWPHFALEYTPIPSWARDIAPDLYFLFYRSPAPFDDTRPQYLVPPVDHLSGSELEEALRATNSYVIKTNHVAHHGAIGHHVQNARAYAGDSTIGKIAAVDCASRIGMFAGGSLAEGWACYATDLMEEVGFLTDLERIAHQHGRIRQLQRALFDLRVHAFDLPLDTAVEGFASAVEVSRAAAEREITRLSMFPGTAIMYWLGTTTIHRLRRELQSRMGARFALRDFHDRFLGYGALPARLIAHLMRRETG